jgi:hypothetical protein
MSHRKTEVIGSWDIILYRVASIEAFFYRVILSIGQCGEPVMIGLGCAIQRTGSKKAGGWGKSAAKRHKTGNFRVPSHAETMQNQLIKIISTSIT